MQKKTKKKKNKKKGKVFPMHFRALVSVDTIPLLNILKTKRMCYYKDSVRTAQ